MGHTLRSNKPSASRLILLEFSLTTVVFALHAKKGTQGIELGSDPRSGVLEREPPSQFRNGGSTRAANGQLVWQR
ncbi:MAG: hypothetical protein DMG42_28540 [Acidobacteria bacterium]|nr:MAG: hypothetical protein DMG42_28540 [Acidobacteriota bacterium]